MKSTKELFCEKVEPVTETGCWIWLASIDKKTGYGWFNLGGRIMSSHRASYELFKGPIPEDKQVLHSCDIPCCVNPNHLRVGTHQENMDDRQKRDRTARGLRHRSVTSPETMPRGEDHKRSKLTAADVQSIKASSESQSALARQYGVSQAQIWRIVRGKTWTHLGA